MGKGYFCVSLDFELMWGRKGRTTIEAYGPNIAGVRIAIPKMLELFTEYSIHATWAVVGLLLAESKADMVAYAPELKPQYENMDVSTYQYLNEVGEDENHDVYHYGYSLARKICACPGQEIGSHTFSHYYALERGQNKEAFTADLQASLKIIKDRLGRDVSSLVYPRNQCNPEYVPTLIEAGITAYRGREISPIYNDPEKLYKRVIRLADTYVNLTGSNCAVLADCVKGGIVDLPASRFFRPYMPYLAFLERFKVKRIKQQMKHAARNGKVFHIWWHPHNVGVMTDVHMAQLREIFEYFQILSKRYGYESRNMGELAVLALEGALEGGKP